MRSPHFVVCVASHDGMSVPHEVLISTDEAQKALHALEVFLLFVPMAQASVWVWDELDGTPVLRVTDGRWRVVYRRRDLAEAV